MKSEAEKKYLVYAEDDLDDFELLQEMIHSVEKEITLVRADNGRQVFQVLSQLETSDIVPCVILLDINMPKMDGYAALQQLKAHPHYRSIPVIMYTTSSHASERSKALQMGAYRFFTKPFKLESIKTMASEFVKYCNESAVGK